MDTLAGRAALTALLAGFGLLAALSASPQGHAVGLWPAGLGAVLVLGDPRRWRAAVVVALVAGATIALAERPLDVAVGLGTATGVGTAAAVWALRRGAPEPTPVLRDDADLRRYLGGSAVGALTAAVLAAATSLLTGWGGPGAVALNVGAAHFASYLVLLPLVHRAPEQGAIARSGERLLQWLVLLVLTPLLFLVDGVPPLAFLLIPILAWGAFRITPAEAYGQMLAVLGIAVLATSAGRGPFAEVPERYGVSVDVRGVLLAAFVATCALIVVPLTLRVGEFVTLARTGAVERDRLATIVAHTPGVAIIGFDPAMRITLFNPGAEELLGYGAEEALGRHVGFLVPAHAQAERAELLGVPVAEIGHAATLMPPGTHMTMRRKDGVERVHAQTVTGIVDDRGRVQGYVSTSEDVTDDLETARAMREALDAERAAVARLREVDAVKDVLVSTISHELRTPMTSIVGFLELLTDGAYGPLEADQVDVLHRVAASSDRLLSLVEDLLTLSRLDADHDLPREPLDLRDAVLAGFDVVAPLAAGRELEVDVEVGTSPVVVLGDRALLERTVVNLVGNAVKFTPDGGRVRVRVEHDETWARVVVVDTGIGIPPEEQDRLFDRFFRSTLAQTGAIPGTGLGLSISHDIVTRHDGTMAVRSQPGEGTEVAVALPLAPRSA